MNTPIEFCDCIDCLNTETPCKFDCEVNLETTCMGCFIAWEEIQEIRFEIDKAQGKL